MKVQAPLILKFLFKGNLVEKKCSFFTALLLWRRSKPARWGPWRSSSSFSSAFFLNFLFCSWRVDGQRGNGRAENRGGRRFPFGQWELPASGNRVELWRVWIQRTRESGSLPPFKISTCLHRILIYHYHHRLKPWRVRVLCNHESGFMKEKQRYPALLGDIQKYKVTDRPTVRTLVGRMFVFCSCYSGSDVRILPLWISACTYAWFPLRSQIRADFTLLCINPFPMPNQAASQANRPAVEVCEANNL